VAALVRSITAVAERAGYQVRSLPSGALSTETFLDFAPHIVLLDLIMPERDGIDVLHQILLADANARVVLMSGYDNGFLRLGAAVATFHGSERVSTLKKPFRNAELLALLQLTDAELAPAG
jgi:DNA-binding response OmpR family regulator